MNTEAQNLTLHIPLSLLAFALALVLLAQAATTRQSARSMTWQIETAQKNLEDMQALEKQYAGAIANREATVRQSAEMQAELEALLTDLLELARTDPEAQRIVEKYNVQKTVNPAATGAAAEEKME